MSCATSSIRQIAVGNDIESVPGRGAVLRGGVEARNEVRTTVLEAASPAQRERAMVERHRAGDAAAFEEYYAEYSGLVFNLALRTCGDRDLAYDLSQEIFLKIFRSLGKFRCRSSLKTWTYRVCLNHCRTRLARRRKRQRVAAPLTTVEGREVEVVDPSRGPEQRALARDEGDRLARALPRLEPQFREALLLRDLEGLSYQEVADVLSVPIGTVRSRIARGRDQLRRALLQERLVERARKEVAR